MEMNTYAERLAWAMRCAGLSPSTDQTTLARMVGPPCKAQNIQHLLDPEKNAKSSKYTPSIAEVLRCDVSWLAYNKGAQPTLRSEKAVREAGIAQYSKNANLPDADALEVFGKALPAGLIPISGYARLGENGWYERVEICGSHGFVEASSSDLDAYVLKVKGDSMFPAIRDGWYVVAEPNHAPRSGSYVAIHLRSGKKMVKEFIFRNSESVTVESVNGGNRLTIPQEEIDALHAIGSIVMPHKFRES